MPVKKNYFADAELKMAALATIGERFPDEYWFRVYTDGSATGADSDAGAGAYSKHFSLNWAVRPNCTNFDGEVAVVKMVQTDITKQEGQKTVIFINSTIKAVSSVNPSRDRPFMDCQLLIHHLIQTGRYISHHLFIVVLKVMLLKGLLQTSRNQILMSATVELKELLKV